MAILKNSRNILLSNATTRVEGAAVTITTGGINTITVDAGSVTPNPASITLTAVTTLYTNPTFTWQYRYGNSGNWTTIGSNSNTLLITLDAAWLTAAGTNSLVQYQLTVTDSKFNTTTQTITFPILRSGASNISLAYSNDSANIPVSSSGTINWAASGGELRVYEGNTPLTLNSNTLSSTYPTTISSYNLSITAISGPTLTIPTITGAATTVVSIGNWGGILSAKAVYRITAYVKNSGGGTSTVSVDVDLNPITSGADAVVNYIWTNSPVIYKDSSNANTSGVHSTLQVQGKKVVGSTTTNFGWVTVTPAGQTESTTSINTSTTPYSFTPTNASTAASYTIKLYGSATVAPANLLDTETVFVVYKGLDGKNRVYIDLTNDSATVATDEFGSGGVYTLATTAVQLLDGTSSVLANATSITITPSTGVTYTYTTNLASAAGRTTAVTLTGPGYTSLNLAVTFLTSDNGTLTVSAVYGGATYTAVFNVTKVKTGVTTPIYDIDASSAVSYSGVTNSFTPATLTFRAYVSRGTTLRANHTTGTWTIEQSADGTTYTTLAGATGFSLNVTTSTMASTTRFIRATLRESNSTSTIVDQEVLTIGTIGANGISPPIFEITNDNASVATAADGTGGDYSRAVGSVRFYNGNGTNLLPSATSVTVAPSTGVSFTYTLNGTIVTTPRTTNLSLTGVTALSVEITGISGQDNGTLTVTATYGGVTFSDTFTVSKVKAGSTGAPAVVYELESDGQFSFNPNTNSFTPSGGVTFTAYSITGNTARTLLNTGTITTAFSTDGINWTANGTPVVSSTSSISAAVLSASTRFIRAQLSVGGVVVDQEVQPISIIGKDGTAAVLVDLTNDNVTIPTDVDGNNGNYTNATTTVQLFSGITSILNQATQIVLTPSTGVTFGYIRNNGVSVNGQTTAQTLAGTTTSLTFSVSNLASPNDTGSITVAATYLGTVYSTTFTISKAKAGTAGTSPTVYELDADSIFTFNSNTNTFTPSAGVTYSAFRTTGNTARVAHTTGTITVSKSLDGTNWTNIISQTAGSASVLPSSLAATDKFIRAQLTVGGVIVDTETYPIVSIGKDGLTPVVVDLSNDSCAVATNTDGTGGNFANATTQVRINDASKTPSNVLGQLTSLSLTGSAGVTYSYTRNGTTVANLTGTSNPTISGITTLNINITAMTQDTGTVTVSAGYGGITYTKDFTVTKVKAGIDATTYEIEADSGILYNNVNFQPGSVVFNAYSSSGNAGRTSFSGGNIILESSTDGATWTAIGTPALNVSTRTLITSSLSANVRQVRARLVVSNVTVDQEIITISSSGINAVALELSNDTTVIPTDAQGNNGNYSGAYTTVDLLSGTTSVLDQGSVITITPSTGVTYKYTRTTYTPSYSTSTSQPITTTTTLTNSYTAQLSLEVTNLTADSGSIDIRVQYGTIVYNKVFSFAKAKTGPETLIYDIEGGASISFDPNTNNFTPASVTYTAYSKSGTNNRVTPIAGAPNHYISILTSTDGTTYSAFGTGSIGSSTYSFNTSILPKTARFIKAQLYTAAGVVADEEIDAITVQGPAGTSGLSARIEPASIVLPADGAGTVTSYTLSVSKIFVYEGSTPLIYDGAGTTNGRYTVTATTQSNITAGAITVINEASIGNIAQVGTASNMSTSDTAKITFTVTGKSALGTTFNFTLEQTFAKLKSGAKGDPGTPGAAGTSGVNLVLSRPSASVFAYANGSVPSYNGIDGYAKLYEGTTEVTNQATWSSTVYTGSGDTGSINTANNTPVSGYGIGYYRLTNIGGLLGGPGALIIRALYKGTTYEAIFNVTKTLTGYEIVNALPTTNLFEGRMVFLTTDDKLYRYTGTAWTAAVPASDLTGQVLANQIADGAINTAKFASGLEPVSIVTSVPTTKSTSSVFNTTDGKLYRWTGTAYTATVPSSDISGTIQAAQLAGIEASKVTGQLTNAQIASLDAAKIAGQLANTQIAAIDATKVTGQLTNAQLAAIDAAKITGQVGSNQISAGAITAGKIAANAVTATEIAAGAITAGKIAANAVTATEIAAGAITTNKIAANAITANEISANAVTASQIAAGAITAGKIAASAVTATELAADAVTASKIQAGAITAGKIAAGSIQASDIAAGAITAGKIAANAITATELAADAVTAGKIQAGAVNAAQIAAGAINADKIAAGAITAGKIAAGAITANEIAAGAITAGKIAAGAITADKIAAGSITAATIGATSLSALTTNTGQLIIGTDGNIKTSGGSFNGAGIFLGYDQNAYKFSVGAGGNSPGLSFDGTTLTVPMFSNIERWKFDNSGPTSTANRQGWTLSGVSANFLTNSMELFPSSSDPVIVFGYDRPLDFKGAQYDKIRVRIRRKGGSSWDGTCYYGTTSHGISGIYYKTIPDRTILNQWVTLEWDMSQLSSGGSDWSTSTIKQVRLDFGNSTGDVFEIDWIAIGRYSSGSIEEITAENSTSIIKSSALATSQLGYEAVTAFRTASSTTKYTAAGLVMEYSFTVPEAGQIVAFWQAATANMRFYRFHMYLNATPTTGRPAGYIFVGENQGSYVIYDDGYSGVQYIFVGSGNGDYNYDTGSAPGAVPAQNIMATVRSGGVYEDAPVMIGTAQAKAGLNTVYIWLSEYNGGEIQLGDATNPSQKLIVFTAKR